MHKLLLGLRSVRCSIPLKCSRASKVGDLQLIPRPFEVEIFHALNPTHPSMPGVLFVSFLQGILSVSGQEGKPRYQVCIGLNKIQGIASWASSALQSQASWAWPFLPKGMLGRKRPSPIPPSRAKNRKFYTSGCALHCLVVCLCWTFKGTSPYRSLRKKSLTWTIQCYKGTSPYRSLRKTKTLTWTILCFATGPCEKSLTWTILCFKGSSPYRSLRKNASQNFAHMNNPVFQGHESLQVPAKKSLTWTIQCFKGTSPYKSLRKTKTPLTWTILCFPKGPCEKSCTWTILFFKGTSPYRSLRNKFVHTIFSCVLRARVPTGHCEKMLHRISLTGTTQCSSVLGARVPTGPCEKKSSHEQSSVLRARVPTGPCEKPKRSHEQSCVSLQVPAKNRSHKQLCVLRARVPAGPFGTNSLIRCSPVF